MFKIFNTESEWEIFQNVIHPNPLFKTKLYTHSKKEKDFFNTITNTEWKDNTAIRPDFISNNIMIEMFEIDDIVSKNQGSNNSQRKADARALRTIKNIIDQIPEDFISKNMNIIAHGDTHYSPRLDKFTPTDSYNHHNYQAYLNNFNRICHKHMDKVEAYRKNYPLKKLGFTFQQEKIIRYLLKMHFIFTLYLTKILCIFLLNQTYILSYELLIIRGFTPYMILMGKKRPSQTFS